MREVAVSARDPARFARIVGDARSEALTITAADEAAGHLRGKAVLNVSSTAAGGGVAEMLHVLLGYVRTMGIDTRWMVIEGSPEFFAVTKRIHNRLYGARGDGGPLGEAEHMLYRSVLSVEMDELAAHARPGDVVLLHDPQTAGLAEHAKRLGCHVVWRCHVGIDEQNTQSAQAWEFLRPYLERFVDQYVFSDASFAPDWVAGEHLSVIWPSIDPFSPKNQDLDPETVEAILTHAGIVSGRSGPTSFTRNDGSPGRVELRCDILRCGPSPLVDVPLVVQVSRWDTMKDMVGVMEAFATHVDSGRRAELVLAGPVVSAVADDPEGAEVLQQCVTAWRDLPAAVRARVQLVCIPMDDLEQNAVIVNAIQRHAAIVTQKSLSEGFGLTAAEAMLKGTPVVVSAVGGLSHQVVDDVTGRLVRDPMDLAAFGSILCELLDDDDLRRRLGEGARTRAVDLHLGDVHLRMWLDVIRRLFAAA